MVRFVRDATTGDCEKHLSGFAEVSHPNSLPISFDIFLVCVRRPRQKGGVPKKVYARCVNCPAYPWMPFVWEDIV